MKWKGIMDSIHYIHVLDALQATLPNMYAL